MRTSICDAIFVRSEAHPITFAVTSLSGTKAASNASVTCDITVDITNII